LFNYFKEFGSPTIISGWVNGAGDCWSLPAEVRYDTIL